MAEYIEREAAYEKCGWYNTVNGKSVCAVRKDEIASIPVADVVPVVHSEWVVNHKSEDSYNHHMCNKCKTDAPFHYTYIDDYDEGFDGEWFYLGQREDGIVEHMGTFCPNCGADMRKRRKDG